MKVTLEIVIETDEAEVSELAVAVKDSLSVLVMPNGDNLYLDDCSVVVKDVSSSGNLQESPTCTKSQTTINWGRVEMAEALGHAVHVTPAIDEKCDHKWEGADGNPERCGKCGLSFMRYVHSCCP